MISGVKPLVRQSRIAAFALLGALLGACSSHGNVLPQAALPPMPPPQAPADAAGLPMLDDRNASSGPIVYVDDTNDELWKINLGTLKATRVGNQGVMLTDIGFDPKNHVLYGVSFTDLYRVNTTNGAATLVGSLGISDANALVFDATGKGYVKGFRDKKLYALNNVGSGRLSVIGDTGNWKSAGDLTFYNNTLVLSGFTARALTPSVKESIVTLNHKTGAVLGVAQTDLTDLYGLASTSADHLYGFADESLYRIIPTAPTAAKRSVLIKNFQSAGLQQILGAAYDGNFQT